MIYRFEEISSTNDLARDAQFGMAMYWWLNGRRQGADSVVTPG